jgi:hypothetical protein
MDLSSARRRNREHTTGGTTGSMNDEADFDLVDRRVDAEPRNRDSAD